MKIDGSKGCLPSSNPEPLAVPAVFNHCWSTDFMSDRLFCGRRFRTFNLIDDFKLDFIEPGTPTQSSFVERFNRTYHDEILNM